jgi:hypothetical protein
VLFQQFGGGPHEQPGECVEVFRQRLQVRQKGIAVGAISRLRLLDRGGEGFSGVIRHVIALRDQFLYQRQGGIDVAKQRETEEQCFRHSPSAYINRG